LTSHHPFDEADASGKDDPPSIFDNVLPPVLGLIVIALFVFGISAVGWHERNESNCAEIAENDARLSCYDRLAIPQPPAKGAFVPPYNQPSENSPP
jgi:hypothetical protein